jgi:hypothetical protein
MIPFPFFSIPPFFLVLLLWLWLLLLLVRMNRLLWMRYLSMTCTCISILRRTTTTTTTTTTGACDQFSGKIAFLELAIHLIPVPIHAQAVSQFSSVQLVESIVEALTALARILMPGRSQLRTSKPGFHRLISADK